MKKSELRKIIREEILQENFSKEKQKFINYWDEFFNEMDISDKLDQKNVIRAYDRLEGDFYSGTLIELISDALDKARIGFSYKKLEDFYKNYILNL